ncbi:MAG: 30S ribosomal protein S20 [Spirochaetes bacterium]|nr:30S ribosomal protein S20 [Spirochaetota bacterium]
MPNKKFAEKRDRQSKKRRLRNRMLKKLIKTQFKKILNLVKEGKKSDAIQAYNFYQKICDKAVKNNVLHKNGAARRKSRAARILKSIEK